VTGDDDDDGWAGTVLVEPLTALAGGIAGGIIVAVYVWRHVWRRATIDSRITHHLGAA
jgi:hypothetical protein